VPALTLTALVGIPIIHQGDDLADTILNALGRTNIILKDSDVLVVTQKVVSKAEGRLIDLANVHPSETAVLLASQSGKDPRIVELILQESRSVFRVRPGIIIVEHRLGFVCANAGIDHSNIQNEAGTSHDWISLLPENPDKSAYNLRNELESRTNIQLGVLIIDSHGRAWRNGTTGVTIGLSGLPGLVDLRGQPDLFGQELHITTVGAADELASAASLLMGQGNEGTPVIHIRGFPYPMRESSLNELLRPEDQDLFR
jgi:coenzyme F420-0:L-glutamate ligase/coenzyme F420-1:gamma-L-glutamate ligase